MELHKPQAEITRNIQDAEQLIEVGASYTHYKNPEHSYEVEKFGTLESSEVLCVIYTAKYGDGLTFIRPVREWLDQVEWQGQLVPRFKKTNL
jgi:hypothetical protein